MGSRRDAGLFSAWVLLLCAVGPAFADTTGAAGGETGRVSDASTSRTADPRKDSEADRDCAQENAASECAQEDGAPGVRDAPREIPAHRLAPAAGDHVSGLTERVGRRFTDDAGGHHSPELFDNAARRAEATDPAFRGRRQDEGQDDAALIRADEGISRRIDALVAAKLAKHGPGAVVLVTQNGRIVHRQGYGLADFNARTPMRPDATFELASISKQFTASAVLQLARQGALGLDDPVHDHFPGIDAKDIRGKRPMTVADLLHMTSGLPEFTRDVGADYTGWTNQRVAEEIGKRGLVALPGNQMKYVNTNYNLLGSLVEKASGQRYSDFVQANLLDPAGMRHSTVLDREGQVIANRPTGYHTKGKYIHAGSNDTPALFGERGVFASATDLARWNGALQEGRILPPDLLEKAWTPGRLNSGKPTDYGFGWIESNRKGVGRVLWHDGRWAGTSTYNAIIPGRGLGVVVLANNEDFKAIEAGQEIARLYDPPKPPRRR